MTRSAGRILALPITASICIALPCVAMICIALISTDHRIGLRDVAAQAVAAQAVAAKAEKASVKPRKVLIVTGSDVPAHKWRETTPLTRAAIEMGGDLEVFVCEDAAILETDALDAYDAVVLNFRNNPRRDPGEKARQRLAKYVRAGGGLVALHFAVYAFSGWEEYQKIIGRVWVGRVSGKKISGHSPRGTFAVRVVRKDHPINRGLADFEIDDELYSKLMGSEKIDVLLDAHSEYSQKREPIAWTRSYGKGRVFVTVLGHDAKSRKNPAFEKLARQGTKWAAGGN